MQFFHLLKLRQLVQLAKTILQLLIGIVFRRIRDQIQHCAETLLGQGVDDMVEHLLMVIHPLDPEPGLSNGKPGLCVLRPKQKKAERRASIVRLLVVHSRESPMLRSCN
jgi:hypothetical protein